MLFEFCMCFSFFIFFFKQKTAYEMRISDWSSDVCSSDLRVRRGDADLPEKCPRGARHRSGCQRGRGGGARGRAAAGSPQGNDRCRDPRRPVADPAWLGRGLRSDEPNRRADDRRHAHRAPAVHVRTSCRLSFAPAAEEQAHTSTSYFMKEKTMKHARLTIDRKSTRLNSSH